MNVSFLLFLNLFQRYYRKVNGDDMDNNILHTGYNNTKRMQNVRCSEGFFLGCDNLILVPVYGQSSVLRPKRNKSEHRGHLYLVSSPDEILDTSHLPSNGLDWIGLVSVKPGHEHLLKSHNNIPH